jgi:hypothetical protein
MPIGHSQAFHGGYPSMLSIMKASLTSDSMFLKVAHLIRTGGLRVQ